MYSVYIQINFISHITIFLIVNIININKDSLGGQKLMREDCEFCLHVDFSFEVTAAWLH